MFDVLGVVDLRGGLAVRAGGGRRDSYPTIDRVAGDVIQPGDATALVRAYRSRWGIRNVYVADLDAIEQRRPQHAAVSHIAAQGVAVWLDAGIDSAQHARRALDCGASRVVVGLETLPSFRTIESIGRDVGRGRVAFSLDLRNGQPVCASPDLAALSPDALVAEAIGAGASEVIVLDLARVGAASGVDLRLIAHLRAAAPSVALLAGGGVRGFDDLIRLKDAGCTGALVATALLDGSLTPDDLHAIGVPRPLT